MCNNKMRKSVSEFPEWGNGRLNWVSEFYCIQANAICAILWIVGVLGKTWMRGGGFIKCGWNSHCCEGYSSWLLRLVGCERLTPACRLLTNTASELLQNSFNVMWGSWPYSQPWKINKHQQQHKQQMFVPQSTMRAAACIFVLYCYSISKKTNTYNIKYKWTKILSSSLVLMHSLY